MKYHRPEDTDVEKRVAEQIVAQLNRARLATNPTPKFSFQMAPPMACYDFSIRAGDYLSALVEVKKRAMSIHDHAEVHVSKRKLAECLVEASKVQARCVLFAIVVYEGIFTVRFNSLADLERFRSHMSGRRDRGRPEDWEEMLLLPTKYFQKVV